MTLAAENITVRFGGNQVLDDVGLTAEPGRITSLIGPNGAGKTTLFNAVTGVIRPSTGCVRIDSTDLTRMSPHRRARAGLGRTFQRLELFGTLSVMDNLRVAASRIPRRQQQVAIDSTIERLDLSEILEVRCDTLSTGIGRVVELGRALVGNPRVLLLDEPASGQNDDETANFCRLLSDLTVDGMAVLLVEHDMDMVMSISHQIYVLDFGRMIASGPPSKISEDPVVQAAYLGEAV